MLNRKNELLPWNNLPEIDEPMVVKEVVAHYHDPVIQFVNSIIQHALQKSASDIHIEPYEKICRIRYRFDGLLYEISDIPINLAERLTTRLKVMGKLDTAERRLPQDGHFHLHEDLPYPIDIRINTCPVLFGEKIVLRLIDPAKLKFDIDTLGFSAIQKKLFLEKLSQSQGMILVTGPTGSGKTVTLYSALHHLNTAEKNILTIEDPVEVQLHGINQVNINNKIGLDFSTALRNFLRQDPDVIMIGEIRDEETAKIAIQSAQTGHLVLSTTHTNNTIETLSRLQSLGVTTYNLLQSITLIIAQRLVRKMCQLCHASGCDYCLNGYYGRTGIYELLPITESTIQLIKKQTSTEKITEHLKQDGFITLRESALEKVAQGVTTLAEIERMIT